MREETADEPLLSSSDATGSKPPWSPREPSVYTDAPFPSGADANGPESLTFNPDAKATPFSASALDDLLPSTSRFPVEEGASSFTEFNLEPESSPYSSEPEPRGSTAEEPLAAAAGMADPEAEVVMPEPAVAPEEILSDLGAAPESSSALDIPALDPLLEVQEAAPSMASVVSMDTVEPLEAFTPEIAADPDSRLAGQLSQEEEARRLAFEALFNSSEPLPLDDFYASPPEAETVLLPNFAGAAKDHPDVFAPDFEIESLNHGRQSEFTSPELTEVKLDEAEPMSAIEMIPERDPLLENPLEEAKLPGIEDVPEPEKASASISSEIDSPVEDLRMFAEAPPEVPEVFEPVHSVEIPQIAGSGPSSESAPMCEAEVIEIEPFEVEATPEQGEAVPELAEARQIVLEAAPSETQQAALEAVYSVPEMPQTLPEPEIVAAAQALSLLKLKRLQNRLRRFPS